MSLGKFKQEFLLNDELPSKFPSSKKTSAIETLHNGDKENVETVKNINNELIFNKKNQITSEIEMLGNVQIIKTNKPMNSTNAPSLKHSLSIIEQLKEIKNHDKVSSNFSRQIKQSKSLTTMKFTSENVAKKESKGDSKLIFIERNSPQFYKQFKYGELPKFKSTKEKSEFFKNLVYVS